MGLDVTAIEKAEFVGRRNGNTRDESIMSVYDIGFDRLDGKEEGNYRGATEFDFAAGSYGNYNEWREWLCRTFLGVEPRAIWDAPEKFAGQPFVELINFSDCEGAIGPVTAAKLLKDFTENKERAKRAADALRQPYEREWFFKKYLDWKRAFELAKNDGFVIFH